MFGYGLLNLGSLVLGLIALALPIVMLVMQHIADGRRWVMLSVVSLGACAISLCLQLFYSAHLVRIEDWSALMDTADAAAWVSAGLLVCTLALNTLALAVHRGGSPSTDERL